MARNGCRCKSGWKSRRNYVCTRRRLATAFDGGEVASKYSEVKCLSCGGKWRTAAVYVDKLRNHRERRYKKLTDYYILQLLADGYLKVNPVSGVVRKRRKVWDVWTDQWIILKRSFDRNGYPSVRIRWNGHRKGAMVHRLVWMAVKGTMVPEGYDIDHRDRNRANPSIRNLRLRSIYHNRGKHEEEVPF